MGNVATKENRPRSSSIGSTYSRSNANDSSDRRSRAYSASSASYSEGQSSRYNSSGHHRSSKGKSKKLEKTQNLVLDPTETVDGGYLQPQGVYTGPQDFKYKVVRQLIVSIHLEQVLFNLYLHIFCLAYSSILTYV